MQKRTEIESALLSHSIITTHNSSVFDLDMYRMDEINLINRDENQCSIIKKLNSTSIRFDKKNK